MGAALAINSMYTPEKIQALAQQLFDAAASPAQVMLFGSQARGDARPDSDVDLLVIEDSLPNKALEYQRLVKIVRYEDVDLILLSRDDYVKRSEWVGSLPYRASREGKVLCG